MKHYIALQDLYNGKRQLNAKKGEVLTCVRDYTDTCHVVIVETVKGDRFSVSKELLKEKM